MLFLQRKSESFLDSLVSTGPAKWISKWRGHGTLKSISTNNGENFLNSRHSRMAKTITF